MAKMIAFDEEARRALERALELAPLWWEATLDLTVLMLDQGALLDAHALVEAGLRAQPDEGSLLALLGQVLDAMEEAGVAPPAATTGPVSTASDDATAPFLLEPRAQNASPFLLVAREEAPAAAPPARRDGSGAHRILVERRRSGWRRVGRQPGFLALAPAGGCRRAPFERQASATQH